MKLAEGTSSFTTNLSNGANAAYGGTAPTTNISGLVHDIVSIVFSVLGVVFFLLMVYAGILWMTAMGETKKVQKAKDIMSQSLIGLIICLMAYSIAYFVTGWLVTIKY